MYTYFDVQVTSSTKARFKRNWLTRTLYVFQANCAPDGYNVWNETGYGYGRWVRV